MANPRARRKRWTLLVTGDGLLGSHLCERLLSEGYRVLCLDNLRTGFYATVTRVGAGEQDFEHIDRHVSTYISLPRRCGRPGPHAACGLPRL